MISQKEQELKIIECLFDILCIVNPDVKPSDFNICSAKDISPAELLDILELIRIDVRYERFDLEATRRELEYCHKLLGNNND